MQFIIEKSKRFVIVADSEKEALKQANTFDDKNSLPYYQILGVLADQVSKHGGDGIDQRRIKKEA